MTDQDHSDRPYEVGRGKPPKHTQFKKGQSGNPKGRRRRRRRKQGINLRKTVMTKVMVSRNGKIEEVPYPIAHIQRIMQRAAKGDPKADQSMFKLYKELDLFSEISVDSNEPFEITLKIGKVKNTMLDDDADKSDSSADGKDHDLNNADEDPANGEG
jgi:uncharacterized protein DUF5681